MTLMCTYNNSMGLKRKSYFISVAPNGAETIFINLHVVTFLSYL